MSKAPVVILIEGKNNTGAVLDQVKRGLMEVGESAHKAGGEVERMEHLVEGAFVWEVAREGLHELFEAMKEAIAGSVEYGEALSHMHEATGISTENLSVLRFASERTGVSFEALSKGFKKLSTEIWEFNHGELEAKQAFGTLGISAKDLAATGGGLYDVMKLVADRFRSMPDGAMKSAAATELFGRAGQDLIPVLNEGAAGVEEFRTEAESLGIVIDSQTAAKMELLESKGADVKGAFRGMSLELTEYLSPALIDAANDMTEFIKALDVSKLDAFRFSLGKLLVYMGKPAKNIGVLSSESLGSHAGYELMAENSNIAEDFDKSRETSFDTEARDQADTYIKTHLKTLPVDPTVAAAKKAAAEKLARQREEAAARMQAAEERYQSAKMALLEESAKMDLARQKSNTEMQLAELDSRHKQSLISDASYYAKKRQLQEDEATAELAALGRQQQAIQSQMDAVHARKSKNKLEEKKNETDLLELQTKYLAIDGQIAEVDAQRVKATAEIAAAEDEALTRAKMHSAEIAAQLEQLQGHGSKAALGESRAKYGEDRQKAVLQYGADSPEVRELDAIQKITEAKIRLGALDAQISGIQMKEKMQELQLEEQLLNHQIKREQYKKELATLRAQESAQLKGLQGEYNSVADAAGAAGEAAKVKLEQSITDVDQSMQKLKSSLVDDLLPVFQELETSPKKWSDAFRQAGNMIEGDMMKIANQHIMEALSGGPHGGGPGGVMGGLLAKLTHRGAGKASNGGFSAGAGTIADAATSLLKQGHGSGGGPVVNIINQGTPQQAVSTGSSGGGLEQHIISVVLKDADTLGPLTKALGGGIKMLGI